MAIEIPLKPQLPHYDLSMSLDGVRYTLEFLYSERAECWYFSLRTIEGASIFESVRVVLGAFLGARSRVSSRPPGRFMAFEGSDRGLDPGAAELGSRVRLLYFTASEIAAIASELSQ